MFKLFPKKGAVSINLDHLQRAMKGNVTAYKLNQADIASMVEGRMMPCRPQILASLLTITFIGQDKLTKEWILRTF